MPPRCSSANSSFAATGDDVAGWRYTLQTYDWNGRPLVTTNPDSTTKEASYSGCGCAGGAVVTLTDEGSTIANGVPKKRQQRISADVLGRTVKTEILNWDGAGPFGTGGSVYSAITNTYNARDQVTEIHEYEGPVGNASQVTTMTYDGYGRLKTKHVPEQSAGTATTWDYNSDDTVQKVTDARGSVSNFTYNSRHLVTLITYSSCGSVDRSLVSSRGTRTRRLWLY